MFSYIYHKILKRPYILKFNKVRRIPGQPLVVFLHGIGNSGVVWKNTIKKLPKDTQYVTIDLLGFGSSEKPDYIDYDIQTHARSVVKTVKKLHFRPSKIIIVGHSLGSLVAIDIAKIYSNKIDSLILCSPPFYIPSTDNKIPNSDDILKNLYEFARDNPHNFMELASRARKYRVVTKDFELNNENIGPYMNTLKFSIINQESLHDAISLPQKIQLNIIRGILDPLVLQKNIKILKRMRPSTNVATVISSHDITSRYEKVINKELTSLLKA